MKQSDKRQVRFETLVKTWAKDVFRYAFWLCGDQDTAEELVQETFTRVWKYLDQLSDDNAAKSWLFTIVKRENARRYERYCPEIETLDHDQIAAKGHYDTSTEAFVLRQALAKLPDEYREPLILQVIGGYSIKEIAQQMDLSTGAVMTRVHRARQKLRDTLQGTENK
ncbi:MAG: sigma-70 family RNA polymerase sigma factor [Candidatus Parabeggiatoa sp.]|nr:sigma-70 family RNA polymerase sigma factor [Candidatus Parabeggiatoa sp.]